MLQYLIIVLDDTSTSFCHYSVSKEQRNLISISDLEKGIFFAMKENLMIQFIYPRYEIPLQYIDIINTIDHHDIKPFTGKSTDGDVLVFDGCNVEIPFPISKPVVLRTTFEQFFLEYKKIPDLLLKVPKIDIVFTDVDRFQERWQHIYHDTLKELADSIEIIFKKGHVPQLNIITDRMLLTSMNNCNAGDTSITLAPNGKFYICPAFYYEREDCSCGDVKNGFRILNQKLYKLSSAPICKHCDSLQCKRCVWLNHKMTLEVNTPSHEQCVISHIERNISRELQRNLRKVGTFMPEIEDIVEVDYLDPFENKDLW